MKKMMATLLSSLMILSVMLTVTVSAEGGWNVHGDVDLRVGVLTDSHMNNADATAPFMNMILDSQVEIANGKIDGMALVGDITYYNASDDCSDIRHYKNIYASIGEKMPGASILYAMGNHEFPYGMYDEETSKRARNAFLEGTGQALNEHKVMGDGYHFIAMSPENAHSLLSEETKSWAMQEIENAIGADSTNGVQDENGNYSFPDGEVPDSTKPVFVLLHAPLPGTIPCTPVGGDVAAFLAYLKTRPQIVMINGHIHMAAQMPNTIWQDGFTAFQGPINSGGQMCDASFPDDVHVTLSSPVCQGSMIEVEDNVVKIYRLDYTHAEEIGEPWTIDIPEIVNNLRDSNPENDLDAYLYSADKRAKVTSTAQFPEGTELETQVYTAGVSVTYPNTAYMSSFDPVQQDSFIRGYRVEAVNENGYVAYSHTHQAQPYLKPEERTAFYTKTINGLEDGKTYTINVYPVMPLGNDGTLGTPISKEITTLKDAAKEDAIRYEIEDYCPETKLNKDSIQASGGGICISAQGGMVSGVQQLLRPADNVSPFTFDFEVELPADCMYKIEYGAGYKSSQNLSKVTLTLDDTITIGDNTKKGDIDRSLDGTYPWKNLIPLYTYYAENQILKAGKHKVTVTVDLPEATKQPYLFCADYIQFDPVMERVNFEEATRIEFENYISSVSIEETDGTPGVAQVREWSNCSGGKCMIIDTTDNLAAGTYTTFTIPVHVKYAGTFQMTFVDCSGMSSTGIFLDSLSGTQLDAGATKVVDPTGGTYFDPSWAIKQTRTKEVYLPEGYHSLVVKVGYRSNKKDFAAYLDYLEFIPIAPDIDGKIEAGKVTTIEMEDAVKRVEKFVQSDGSVIQYANGTVYVPTVNSMPLCSGGKYAVLDTPDGQGVDAYLDLPVKIAVKDAGIYRMKYVVTGNLSAPGVFLDGNSQNFAVPRVATDESKNETGNYSYFNNWATAGIHEGTIYLSEGMHTLYFRTWMRGGTSKDYAQLFDFLEFSPVESFTVAGGTASVTAITDRPVSGTAILALYNGNEMVGVGSAPAENTKLIEISAPASQAVTHAKVMVWEDLENINPIEKAKVFEVK